MLDWESIAKVAVVVLPFATALAGSVTGVGRPRRQMKHDAELVKDLPEGAARSAVLKLVEENADLLLGRRRLTIDKGGLALAVIGSVTLGVVGVWLASLDRWWAWALALGVGFLWLIFFVGIFESAQRRDRVAEKAAKAEAKAEKARLQEKARESSAIG